MHHVHVHEFSVDEARNVRTRVHKDASLFYCWLTYLSKMQHGQGGSSWLMMLHMIDAVLALVGSIGSDRWRHRGRGASSSRGCRPSRSPTCRRRSTGSSGELFLSPERKETMETSWSRVNGLISGESRTPWPKFLLCVLILLS